MKLLYTIVGCIYCVFRIETFQCKMPFLIVHLIKYVWVLQCEVGVFFSCRSLVTIVISLVAAIGYHIYAGIVVNMNMDKHLLRVISYIQWFCSLMHTSYRFCCACSVRKYNLSNFSITIKCCCYFGHTHIPILFDDYAKCFPRCKVISNAF
jgi:hypothetical protein